MKRFIGLAALVLATACGSAQTPVTTGMSGSRDNLGQAEIQANRTSDMTAYELIAHLRPEYLRNRGQNTLRETTSASGPPTYNAPTATVYLDNARFGDLESLKNISAESILRIQYLSASAATTRFGMDNSAGAILVFTK
jgi:hypothetical protein